MNKRPAELPAALVPVRIPSMHLSADVHGSVVILVTALDRLGRGEKAEHFSLLGGGLLCQQLEHGWKGEREGRRGEQTKASVAVSI
eukprot:3786654-Rhodomonas_salina.1